MGKQASSRGHADGVRFLVHSNHEVVSRWEGGANDSFLYNASTKRLNALSFADFEDNRLFECTYHSRKFF